MTQLNPLWLPEGHHWDLHIEHCPLPGAGAFTGGGWKLVWHTTQSKWDSTEGIRDLFITRDKNHEGSEPTILVGGGIGKKKHPSVVQFLPFNRAARTLKHPSGTPETNRANCIQIEVCGFAEETGKWPDHTYKTLANVVALVNHRRPIANHVPRSFKNDRRFTSGGFVATRGHVGHKHVPFNDHTDPGDGFDIWKLLRFLADAPHQL